MEAPHIGWLFDKCLGKSDIDDVFAGAVLENCGYSHVYSDIYRV